MSIRSKYLTPGLHIFIWTALLLVPVIVFHNVKWETGLPNGFFFLTNLYHIGLFYFNAFYLYPQFLTRKRWPLYLIFIGALLFGSYYAKIWLLKLFDPSFILNEANDRIIFFPPIPFLIASVIFRLMADRSGF